MAKLNLLGVGREIPFFVSLMYTYRVPVAARLCSWISFVFGFLLRMAPASPASQLCFMIGLTYIMHLLGLNQTILMWSCKLLETYHFGQAQI